MGTSICMWLMERVRVAMMSTGDPDGPVLLGLSDCEALCRETPAHGAGARRIGGHRKGEA